MVMYSSMENKKQTTEDVAKIIEDKINEYNKTCEKGLELTKEDVVRYLEYKFKIKANGK